MKRDRTPLQVVLAAPDRTVLTALAPLFALARVDVTWADPNTAQGDEARTIVAPSPPPLPCPSDAVRGLLPTYLTEMARDSRDLGACLGRRDRSELAHQVHATRGKCAFFGDTSAEAVLAQLEEGAASAPWETLARLFVLLAAQWQALGIYEPSVSPLTQSGSP
jgi:hypothetical protein